MENNQTKEKLLAEIERLKKELKKKKKYGLVWEEKPEDVVEMCKEKLPVLKEVKNKEIITDKNKPINLLIEGDNYHALSVLNYTHKGKIDVIYIDPPYNTGNKDFKYNDSFVDREDSYRHSKWLSFMGKRLKLAQKLLKNTGVIFISIDDNEIAQLKLLSDDVFGEKNFIVNFIVNSAPAGTQSSKNVSIQHSYCLCYARSINNVKFILERTEAELENRYSEQDEKGSYYSERLWKRGIGGKKEDVPSLHFPVYYNPKTKQILVDDEYKNNKSFVKIIPYHTRGVLGRWTWSRDTMKNGRDNLIVKKVAGEWKLHKKVYAESEVGKLPFSIIGADIGRTEMGSLEVKEIFNAKVFDYPKPLNLICHFLNSVNNKSATILDFMAGSGTTGHAALELNKEDGGNRRFILCTNNELNGFEKELREKGVKENEIQEHGICRRVCYPRIEKVIEGYKNLKGEKIEGLGGNLKYFKTDFVDYKEATDKNKIKLTREAVEMLCVKEGTFESVLDNEAFKIFKNHDHYAGIIFDQLVIEDFKKAIKDISAKGGSASGGKSKFSVYIFSLGDDSFDEEFEDIKQKVKLSPIPEAILKVYRRIFK
ncbi:MAG: site-specific DNA-methyltransferase [bacterium]|nr:site-specific DNA-methyltransferase [bacterium]